MFDEKSTATDSPEAEDMFYPLDGVLQPGEIKSALAHNKLKPVSKTTETSLENEESAGSGVEISPPLLSKKGVFITLVVLVAAALVAGAVWVLWRLPKKSTVLQAPPAVTPNVQVGPPSAPEPSAPVPETLLVQPENIFIDSDADGLTDQEEAGQGTDKNQTDTDNDGLSDYEELMIWKTNPLNPDTDGDTHLDGLEVKNNFNPNGAGKLLELPK